MHPGHELINKSRTIQDRIADLITTFSGSMMFVYIHIVWFIIWIVFRIEHYPFGLLTMIVSLEAIFLSTFVMISQNRMSQKDRVTAQMDYETNQSALALIEKLVDRLIEEDE